MGAACLMNNTSKFRHIDAFGQLCLQWGRSEELRLTGYHEQHSGSQTAGGCDCKLFPTFFAGHACVMLQFKSLQVEGITVVSKRNPCPRSQSVGALARVGPLVYHRLI